MKKIFIISIIILGLGILIVTNAQQGWIKAFGGPNDDLGLWVEQTSDSGYIVTGQLTESHSPDPVDYVYLIKTDYNGDTLWTRAIGGGEERNFSNIAYCVQQTMDGGYIISGVTGSTKKLWLLRTDQNGDTLWTRVYGDGGFGYSVRETHDGNYLVVAEKNWLVWLLKVDSSGDTIWTRTYEGMIGSGAGGQSMVLTEDGGCIITGFIDTDLWIAEINSTGDTLWTRTYQFGISGKSDLGLGILPTTDGSFIICGTADFELFLGSGYLLLFKIDSLGNEKWSHIYSGQTPGMDMAHSLRQTPDQGYIIAGNKGFFLTGTGAVWLLKTDSEGDTLWTRTFGIDGYQERADCIQLASDGGYVITGFTSLYSTNGSRDVVLIKTDSLGYVSVEEEKDGESEPSFNPISPIGSQVVLRFEGYPEGFHARVFDSSGRLVDQVRSISQSGTISWGKGYGPGVFFVVPDDSESKPQKIVLIR